MKMSLNDFTKYIEKLRLFHKQTDALYKLNIDIINFEHPDSFLFKFVFNENQREYLGWWLWDLDGVDVDKFSAEDTHLIETINGEDNKIDLDTIEKLYNYLVGLSTNEL